MPDAALPQVIAEIAEVAGPDAAWALARARGGQRVFVPAEAENGHWLVELVGMEAARVICKHFSTNGRGGDVLIPMASAARRRELFDRTLREHKVDSAAAILGVHRRTVQRHRKRMRDKGQGRLFD